jgi:chromosome partitioning protein
MKVPAISGGKDGIGKATQPGHVMKVLAIINGKGGVGKTTLSTHLAIAAERLGLIVAVLDLDPQPSSAMWHGDRNAIGAQPSPSVIACSAAELPLRIRQAREQEADLLILDTPPRVEGEAPEAAKYADAILIPTPPKPIDVKALPQTIQLARASKKPFFVVLNNAPVQGLEVDEVTASLTSHGIEVAPFILHSRKAFYSHMQQGETAADFDPGGKAAAEILGLVLWVAERVGLFTNKQKYNAAVAAAGKVSRLLADQRESTGS